MFEITSSALTKVGSLLHQIMHVYVDSDTKKNFWTKRHSKYFICWYASLNTAVVCLQVKWKHNGHYIHPMYIEDEAPPSSNTLTTSKYSQFAHISTNQRTSGKFVASEKGQTLYIKNVDAKDSGVYSCIVTIGINMDLASAKLVVKGKYRSSFLFSIN